jgi:hypothetical protein
MLASDGFMAIWTECERMHMRRQKRDEKGRHDPKKLAASGDKLAASALLITREFH